VITAIVLFASVVALDVARHHEIGRSSVTPPNPGPTRLRPQRPRWHQRKYPHREHGSSQDVRTFVSPLVDKPWSARVDGHPVDTPAV